jgi:transcriptional regulator with XRE-family HTH domain
MDIKSIGQHIKHQRERVGMSQVELARRMGVQQSNLSRLERGLQGVTIETLGMYARVLGVGIEELTRERDVSIAEQKNRVPDPRLTIQCDPKAAPGLRELAKDAAMCEVKAINNDEWRQLAAIPIPHTVTMYGFLQILITLRAVQTPHDSGSVTET